MSARRCKAQITREQSQLATLQRQLGVAAEDLNCAVQEVVWCSKFTQEQYGPM